MPKFFNTPALVIHKKKQREGDILVTIYTESLGKINCIAKGAQSLKSRRLGHLETGNIIKAGLYEKDSYYWLSESTTISPFIKTGNSSLSQINLLFYFLEIINALLPFGQPQPEIYQLAVNSIQSISQNSFSGFIQQEILFIEKLGYGLPEDIVKSFSLKNYSECQKLIKKYYESIIEKPLKSYKLFT